MSEDIGFSLVGQHTTRLLDEAARERLLHVGRDGHGPTPSMRTRVGHVLMDLGGRIAGDDVGPLPRRPIPPSRIHPGSAGPAC